MSKAPISDIKEDGSPYQSVILERSRKPRFRRPVAGPVLRGNCNNPMCGDEVEIEVRLAADGLIEEAGFSGQGCAILLASSDLMAEQIAGLATDQARELGAAFDAMLAGGPEVANQALAWFAPLRAYPARLRCATLPWQALTAALDGEAT